MTPPHLAAAAFVLVGCAQLAPNTPPRAEGWTVVPSVRFEAQKGRRDCGPAALAMLLRRWGLAAAPFPSQSPGVAAGELRDRARELGLASFAVPGTFDDLAAEIAAGRPVIIGTARTHGGVRRFHFVLVVGHDRARARWMVADPDRGWRALEEDELDVAWSAARRTMVVAFPRS